MTIHRHNVGASSIGELLGSNLRIPPYQRPYVWSPATAHRLLDDILDAFQTSEMSEKDDCPPYVLGAVILHKDREYLNIVDGQQRLMTLRMLLRILEGDQPPSNAPQNTSPPAVHVWFHLHKLLETRDAKNASGLAQFIRKKCQVVRIVTDDIDEAFRVFDSQNYRGKPLMPHDLLKAHHLREMHGELDSLKAAVVDSWESSPPRILDELFSIYLFRISQWSRGESAPEFTSQHIGTFKGFSVSQSMTPAIRYHLAAQVSIPLMSMWQPSPKEPDALNIQRSRFQLDAPQLSGRNFFEMVSFMTDEVERLKEHLSPVNPYSKSSERPITYRELLKAARYRKVTELHLAAMLYYVNRYSDADLAAATDHLFKWSFDLRVRHLRVMHASINNAGYGKDGASSPFATFRNSNNARVVQRFSSSGERYPTTKNSHETALHSFLNGTHS